MLNVRHNKKAALALKEHQEWVEKQEQLAGGPDDLEMARRFLALLYDHVVVEWRTTIAAKKKPVSRTATKKKVAARKVPARRKAATGKVVTKKQTHGGRKAGRKTARKR